MHNEKLKRTVSAIITAFILCLATPIVAASNTLSPRLAALAQAVEDGHDDQVITGFWDEMRRRGTPLIEAIPSKPGMMRVTFLARGPRNSARIDLGVFGIFNTHPWTRGGTFERLPRTDVWYRSYELPSALRASYLLISSRDQVPGLAFQRHWDAEDADGRERIYSLLGQSRSD